MTDLLIAIAIILALCWAWKEIIKDNQRSGDS